MILNLWRVKSLITTDGLSDLHNGLREKKCPRRLLQEDTRMKWLQRTVWRMGGLCSLATFLYFDFASAIYFYSVQWKLLSFKEQFTVHITGNISTAHCTVQNIEVKRSNYRPWVSLRVPGGWGSQSLWESAHEFGRVVNPTHRPPRTCDSGSAIDS
jgi:hypothetical protein